MVFKTELPPAEPKTQADGTVLRDGSEIHQGVEIPANLIAELRRMQSPAFDPKNLSAHDLHRVIMAGKDGRLIEDHHPDCLVNPLADAMELSHEERLSRGNSSKRDRRGGLASPADNDPHANERHRQNQMAADQNAAQQQAGTSTRPTFLQRILAPDEQQIQEGWTRGYGLFD